jgi:hypothetical protein
MTPPGVEHLQNAALPVQNLWVLPSMTPPGVEHSGKGNIPSHYKRYQLSNASVGPADFDVGKKQEKR